MLELVELIVVDYNIKICRVVIVILGREVVICVIFVLVELND